MPEYKIEQEPTNYGLKDRKRQRYYRTDVTFYKTIEKGKELAGVSEIFTLDMLAHLLPTEELKEKLEEKGRAGKTNNVATSASKILYLVKASKSPISNILLVVTLPERVTKRPSFPDWMVLMGGSKNAFNVFSQYVKKLESKIRENGVNPCHILIKENEVLID
ncbi:MAG: hypothetical protein QW506_04025 [Thermoproteota archaeon]